MTPLRIPVRKWRPRIPSPRRPSQRETCMNGILHPARGLGVTTGRWRLTNDWRLANPFSAKSVPLHNHGARGGHGSHHLPYEDSVTSSRAGPIGPTVVMCWQ
jgi:hypothetical protein